ncbi:MAG: hypothetical protein IKK49_08205 [Clostridia bacterium]|nr:hypothetical protein [Clostridia bacterium]
MEESFVVSFFVDESYDKEANTYIGSRFIPYIYELMEEHKNIVFLLPYSYASSKSIARTVRVLAKSHFGVKARCRMVCGTSARSVYEKMVDMSDISFFYFEKDNCSICSVMKYVEETDKKYIKMK